MTSDTPNDMQRPEGRLIEQAMRAQTPRLSQRAAARLAGMSETRWRQIVTGYQLFTDGVRGPVAAPAATLARMARVVGVSAEQLEATGRTDAADELRGLTAAAGPSAPIRQVESDQSANLRFDLGLATGPDDVDGLTETVLDLHTRIAQVSSRIEHLMAERHAMTVELITAQARRNRAMLRRREGGKDGE